MQMKLRNGYFMMGNISEQRISEHVAKLRGRPEEKPSLS
jgi:hypothetical protein